MGHKEDNRAAAAFSDGQIAQWEAFKQRLESGPCSHPLITVCMEPGSGGSQVGKQVAETLGFDYFHRELLEVMSKCAMRWIGTFGLRPETVKSSQ